MGNENSYHEPAAVVCGEKSATTSKSWGYEVGPSKGPGPSLLVVADFYKRI